MHIRDRREDSDRTEDIETRRRRMINTLFMEDPSGRLERGFNRAYYHNFEPIPDASSWAEQVLDVYERRYVGHPVIV